LRQAVLLLAHGAPERLEDIPEYLTNVRGGSPPNDKVVDEVRRRHAAVGGSSPLTARTADQARKLESQLGLTVYVGMRNWSPTIADALRRAKMDGVERLVAVCLAPQ
jgi:ferrochelatase